MDHLNEVERKSVRMLRLALSVGSLVILPISGCNENVVTEGDMTEESVAMIDELDDDSRALAVLGGRLYDEWLAETTKSPLPTISQPNPMMNVAYDPDIFDIDESYRCSRCHGWDYNGADGQYGFSSDRYTGFPGILDAATLSIDEIVEFLTNGKSYPVGTLGARIQAHNYDGFLTEDEIKALAYFVKYGTLDTTPYIGKFTAMGLGDPIAGGDLFAGDADCASAGCHGADGTAREFEPGEVVGTIGNENPWEMLHKIRFGQPGSDPLMTSSYEAGLSTQDAVDVMTFTQTLPTAPTP